MSILVTGAAGLIGSNIVRQLLDRGDAVVGLDRNLRTGRLDDLMSERRITALEVDITDVAAVTAAVQHQAAVAEFAHRAFTGGAVTRHCPHSPASTAIV